LLDNFAKFGIKPAAGAGEDGTWPRWIDDLVYSRTHFDSMLRDDEEMFRFVWGNRDALDLDRLGYIEVQSVRPSTRIAPDGFVLRETVADYVQILTLAAEELRDTHKVPLPLGMDDWTEVTVFGGGTLVFDEYGQLKYRIAKHLFRTEADIERQKRRLQHLWDIGYFERKPAPGERFSGLHLARAGLVERQR
jgi:hypothetical protein